MADHILFVNKTIPYPPQSGNAIRVFGAAEALSLDYVCHLAVFEDEVTRRRSLLSTGVFRSVDVLPQPLPSRNLLRHFRLTDGDYLKHYHRDGYRNVVRHLRHILQEHDIVAVIAVTLHSAEYLDAFPDIATILDDYDCYTLTYERALQAPNRPTRRHPFSIVRDRLALLRTRNHESSLSRRYDAITTIAPADHERLQTLNRRDSARIVMIPNGVNDGALKVARPKNPTTSGIVFWGHLSFPPNSAAVRWFHKEVYVPYLAHEGIEWHIIGGDAPEELLSIGRADPRVRFHGFVESLYETAVRYPIFVNPLTQGSGFKNKLIEAFALGLAVVTTPLGVESVPEALPEVHYLAASTPGEFAQEVLRLRDDRVLRARLATNARTLAREWYSWDHIGAKWRNLVANILQA